MNLILHFVELPWAEVSGSELTKVISVCVSDPAQVYMHVRAEIQTFWKPWPFLSKYFLISNHEYISDLINNFA